MAGRTFQGGNDVGQPRPAAIPRTDGLAAGCWSLKVSARSHWAAKKGLALLYSQGTEGEARIKYLITAWAWTDLATARNDQASQQLMDQITQILSPANLEKAAQLSKQLSEKIAVNPAPARL